MITWSSKKDKIILCKDGVYFALTEYQVSELKDLLGSVIAGSKQFYKKDSRNNKIEGETKQKAEVVR